MRRLIVCAALLASCGPELDEGRSLDTVQSELSAALRRARAQAIRDVANQNGLTNGALLGGIGDAETGLAHCWSEATWACQGPNSSSCNGPVIAGAGDGPCSLQQGGLGIFQFDGGTFDQTIARDGAAILTLEGNIAHVIPFVTNMVIRSQFIDGVDTEAQAIEFMNRVPIQAGDPLYEAWISTVTRYYNGCSPTASCWSSRRGRYSSLTTGIYAEMGTDFWGRPTPPPPPPVCDPIPRGGRTIEETDGCYSEGGGATGWRVVNDTGSGGSLKWTYTIDGATDNFGVWSLDFAEEGTYRIEVHSDGGTYFQSRRARYTIEHDGMTESMILDQTSGSGFLPLAELHFARGGDQRVRLEDSTGEPYADRVMIGFDAIRVVRVEPMAPPIDPPPPPPIDPEPLDPLDGIADQDPAPAAETIDGLVPSRPREDLAGTMDGGCRCVSGQPRSNGVLLVALAGLLLVVRRRFS
jgi:hypothetical protein